MTEIVQATTSPAAPVLVPGRTVSRQRRQASSDKKRISVPKKAAKSAPCTVFDRLYDEYLPFRLYADYMLGKSTAALAKQFGLSEHWISERIEALRLCLGKQVRINLLSVVG